MNPTLPDQQQGQIPLSPQQGGVPQLPAMPQQAGLQGNSLPTGLHPSHNQVYEMLRQALMQAHQMGVPGLDKVLAALNATHVGLMGGQAQSKQGGVSQKK